jgi:CheY-like chemotaxis protein
MDAGSTFTIVLPCTIVASPLDRPLPIRQDLAPGDHRPASILIAEDNDINRELVIQMLARLGHRATTASNGREALVAAQANTFDLVLMDIQMPEMDGLTAAAAIRALPGLHGSAPIVAVTANAMVGDRERYLAAGFDDYLAKPLHLDQLQEVISRWTDGPEWEPVGATAVALDPQRVAEIKRAMANRDFVAFCRRLPEEIDLQIARAENATRANDIDGVRVAFRALHEMAAEFGLSELAKLSGALSDDIVHPARSVERSATIQDAVVRAKTALDELVLHSRDETE